MTKTWSSLCLLMSYHIICSHSTDFKGTYIFKVSLVIDETFFQEMKMLSAKDQQLCSGLSAISVQEMIFKHSWYTLLAYIIMMVADDLAPNRCQVISNHRDDWTMIYVAWLILHNIQLSKKLCSGGLVPPSISLLLAGLFYHSHKASWGYELRGNSGPFYILDIAS